MTNIAAPAGTPFALCAPHSATDIAERLGLDFGLVHKERQKKPDAEPEVTFVGDVSGRVRGGESLVPHWELCRAHPSNSVVGRARVRTVQVAIIVDDIIDTANTIITAADVLVKNGATKVYAIITHGQLSGNAIEMLGSSVLEAVIVSNSIPQEENLKALPKLRTFDIAPTFAEAIRRIHNGESVSFLFGHIPMD